MDARDRGRQSVRSLTATLALSGITLVGALSIAAYTGIEAAKAAGTQTTSEQGYSVGSDDSTSATPTASSSSSSSSGSSSSASAGISAGSGSSQTSSSGS